MREWKVGIKKRALADPWATERSRKDARKESGKKKPRASRFLRDWKESKGCAKAVKRKKFKNARKQIL